MRENYYLDNAATTWPKPEPGNVHVGTGSLEFLEELFAQLHNTLEETRAMLEMRMVGAFFRDDALDLLDVEGVEGAVKLPMYLWQNLKEHIAKRRHWQRADDTVQCFERRHHVKPWGRTLRVLIYRKKVAHDSRKNFQLDLFDTDDRHYEYSATTTNKRVTGRTLWFFMCRRGAHEKVYGKLKKWIRLRLRAESAFRSQQRLTGSRQPGVPSDARIPGEDHRTREVNRSQAASCASLRAYPQPSLPLPQPRRRPCTPQRIPDARCAQQHHGS